jgi:hypothetical protein
MRGWVERIPLQHLPEQPRFALLREPVARDELSLQGVDTRSAVMLLDGLCKGAAASVAELSASDRDRLLAALHRALWGDRIVSSLDCESCGAAYDLSFELSALQRQLAKNAGAVVAHAPRVVEDENGAQFHLPGASDEEDAAQLGLAAGVQRLHGLVGADASSDVAALGERLEAIAPLLDVELDARCAECAHPALARFDIQSFVLQRLLDERESVLDEVHTLASGYGWSLQDVLGLPRGLRRSLVQRFAPAPAAWG